ncbi:hypothetical protein [Naasia sp. SYSU D00948]|uniref:hypothetical protein n=1 Tax=Naasia sp. SYSU D00948 TaxID=2817379 RepID=UPI001B311E6C|nr:hypothetical protein [Naasia sp. SYSU D00948]
MTDSSERPRDTEVPEPPTVASVAAVASTTDDLEAAQPSHPDRPVGVNVDTASLGTEPGATEELAPDEDGEDSDEALGASQTDAADSREA